MHRSMTHRRSRAVATLATAAALALTLTACTQGSATNSDPAPAAGATDGAQEPVTVRYLNFSANDGHEADLDALVTAFQDANPDVVVEVETLPYADYFTALQTAVAGGTVADAFELNYENFVTYATNGALAELEGVDGAAYKESLLDAFTLDGTQFGLPESFSNVVLFYNAGLFEAAGVEAPTADWTWAEEKAAAEALTDTAAGVWGDYQPISFHEFYKTLAQAGGEFFNADKTEATFAGPEGVAAATWLVGKSGTTMPTEADGAGSPDFDSTLFMDGKLAMWHTGIWMFGGVGAVEGLDWDIAVEPGSTTKASAMFTNGVVVSATSEVKDAAQQWVEFLTSSDEMVQTRLDTSWELPPVADESKVAAYLDVTPPANRQAVFDSLDAVVLPPVIESQQEMQDIVSEELGNAAAGRKPVEQALNDAQDRVNALLG
ncbi:sugar ABC transporter substrate-binding protein [Cellulomonas sp. KRMCY2]|uniref:ABC transporter substrate-binding protein n=1 Tax=Cellulomonas sp. KRMCY2 TaxID=1304865 RepID=UPI0004B18F13|nr:sugar ABC transporter substrate-binding protein [Cellulomonas sp. KRMCY2]